MKSSKKFFTRVIECKTCGQTADDTQLDYTEKAHPAWWRGHEAGLKDAAEKILEVLDFKWDGSGVLDVPCLDTLRLKIRQLQTAYERECLKVSECGQATYFTKDELSSGQLGWSRSYKEVVDLKKDRDLLRNKLKEALATMPDGEHQEV